MNNILRKIKQLVLGIFFVLFLTLGWFYKPLGFFIVFCMFAGIGIAFFAGRKWCDWYCPRGSFFDSLLKPVSPNKKIPKLFRNIYFRLLILIFLFGLLGYRLTIAWPSFSATSQIFLSLLTATTIVGIVLGLFLHPRTWCYVCPVGTIASLISKNKKPLKLDKTKCVKCGICEKVCPVQLKPYDLGKTSGDCLKCEECVKACPKDALKF